MTQTPELPTREQLFKLYDVGVSNGATCRKAATRECVGCEGNRETFVAAIDSLLAAARGDATPPPGERTAPDVMDAAARKAIVDFATWCWEEGRNGNPEPPRAVERIQAMVDAIVAASRSTSSTELGAATAKPKMETDNVYMGYRDPNVLTDPVCARCLRPPWVEGDHSTCICYPPECPNLFIERPSSSRAPTREGGE